MPQDRPEDYNTDLVNWTDGFLSRYQPGQVEVFDSEELAKLNRKVTNAVDSGLDQEDPNQ